MSWQEELRKLDEELAAGQISADDYRARRDQVLASAVTSGSTSGSQAPSKAESTQFIQAIPVEPAQGPSPTPDKTPDEGGGDADKTQVVSDQGGNDVERTQTVGGWQTARPGGDADRTQIVPGVPPQSVVGQTPRAAPPPSPPAGFQQPPWGQQEELSPPWAGSEFPPLVATGTPDWIRQGPEVFEEGGGRGKAGRIIAIVAAVVLLAGIAFGAFWIWGRGNDNAGGAGTTSSVAPTTQETSKPPPDPLPIGTLPGTVTENKAVDDFADVPGQNYLTPPEISAYQAGKAGKTKLVLSDVDGDRLVVMLSELADARAAATAAKALNQVQITNGMVAGTGSPKNVLVVQREPKGDQKGRLRAHYVHENIVVRVDLTASNMNDAVTQFNDILAAQLEVLPADA